ncbi:hypothetical protein [Spiroplasma endosymbiont of Panorpa germanica]|uniref:hypothetical protein n=1 Tax=Spiroplasma endosymbiont of Panorpa germanica TaxID=3066314 RepID=UPI0030D5F90F
MLIIWLVILIIAVIIAIWSIMYIFIRKGFYTNFNKNKKDKTFEKHIFKYDNILESLGGLDNVEAIESVDLQCSLNLYSKSLVDFRRLKKMGIKAEELDEKIILSLRDYNFTTFVLKTKRLLKNT